MPSTIASRRRKSKAWSACHSNDIKLVRNWLGKVRARDKSVPGIDDIDIFSNYTPLMLACGANNVDVIKELINAGADVLRGNDDNLTPAHICAKNGYGKALSQLLLQDPKVLYQRTKSTGLYPLHYACESNRISMVKYMFRKDTSETYDLVSILGQDALQYSDQVMQLIEQAEKRHKDKKFEVEAAKMKESWR